MCSEEKVENVSPGDRYTGFGAGKRATQQPVWTVPVTGLPIHFRCSEQHKAPFSVICEA